MDSSDPAVNRASFKFRPDNSVTAILSSDRVGECLTALGDAGVDVEAVDVLTGPEGAEILDQDGSNHGLRARLWRTMQKAGSSENELMNYSSALQDGETIVCVPVADETKADAVGTILGRCGGERMLYFRSTAVERL